MSKYTTFLAGLLFLVACSGESTKQSKSNYQELRHPNGLIVRIPPTTTAEQTPTGYIVRDTSSMKSRYAKEVAIQRLAKVTDPEPTLTKTKKVGSRSVSYQIDKTEGGSGGAEYRLRVLLVDAGTAISYEQHAQSESSEPNFDLCWELIKTTELVHGK
jgi:hypothetical protein